METVTVAAKHQLFRTREQTFALCVEQDVLFKRGVSGIGEGLGRELREALLQVGPLLRRAWWFSECSLADNNAGALFKDVFCESNTDRLL